VRLHRSEQSGPRWRPSWVHPEWTAGSQPDLPDGIGSGDGDGFGVDIEAELLDLLRHE